MTNPLNNFSQTSAIDYSQMAQKKSNQLKKILFLFFFMNLIVNSFSQEKGQGHDEIIPENRAVIYLNYDDAGNQTQRFYCYDDGSCQIPDPPTKKSEEETSEAGKEETESTAQQNIVEVQQNIADSFSVYPNPTKGPLLIKWKQSVKDKIQAIKIIGYHTPYNRSIPFDQNNLFAEIDLSYEMPSFYFVQFYLTDGQIISKKIIKD